jgi:hypothetical protein
MSRIQKHRPKFPPFVACVSVPFLNCLGVGPPDNGVASSAVNHIGGVEIVAFHGGQRPENTIHGECRPMALRKYCTLRTFSPVEPSCSSGQFVRLHLAIGYITPADRLAGRHLKIFAERNRKLELARGKTKRQSLTESIIASSS